ncbi:MAG: hypothetical protein QXQ71_02955 [Desulfurococcaceae archaeon]
MKTTFRAIYIGEVFLTYTVLLALTAILFFLLTRDVLTSFGIYISLIAWWGWPIRQITLDQWVEMALGVCIPLIVALLTRYITTHKQVLKGILGAIISVSTYYVAGTIYYIAFPVMKPDIDILLAFSIWMPLIVLSSAISHSVVNLLKLKPGE